MPIKRMLEGRNFDPKAAAILVDAFKSVVADLRLRSVADEKGPQKSSFSWPPGEPTLTLQRYATRPLR